MKYLGIVFGIFGLESIVKRHIDQKKEKPDVQFGKCRITRCRNKGAIYSLGEGKPENVRMLSASVLTGVVMHWLNVIVMGRKRNIMEKLGASLLLGGSLSNVWDRFTRKYVVDYIHINIKYLRKIIFNISDICIVVGGCITMIVNMFRFFKEE